MTLLDEVAGTALFETSGRTWTWGDVFLAARLWGQWEPWLDSVRDRESPDDPRAAEVAFRRERRLISADELRDWLAARRLTVDDWRAWVRGEPGETWTAGICSGVFDRWAEQLAERAAAAAAADPPLRPAALPSAWSARLADDDDPRRADELWYAERAYEKLCQFAGDRDAVARTIASTGTDWLRGDFDLLEAGDEDVAREAALLVRADGMNLDDAARTAGLSLASGSVYVADIDADLRPRLMSAAPGELVGPVPLKSRDTFALAHVRAKVEPSIDDPDVASRAAHVAVGAALERAVREEVRWHDRD